MLLHFSNYDSTIEIFALFSFLWFCCFCFRGSFFRHSKAYSICLLSEIYANYMIMLKICYFRKNNFELIWWIFYSFVVLQPYLLTATA